MQERKSNPGRKWIDPLVLFMMLVLEKLLSLSDKELEYHLNNGPLSFEELVGLGIMN